MLHNIRQQLDHIVNFMSLIRAVSSTASRWSTLDRTIRRRLKGPRFTALRHRYESLTLRIALKRLITFCINSLSITASLTLLFIASERRLIIDGTIFFNELLGYLFGFHVHQVAGVNAYGRARVSHHYPFNFDGQLLSSEHSFCHIFTNCFLVIFCFDARV